MGYGLDFREKVMACYENSDYSQPKVAELFGISISTFKRWLSRVRSGEGLEEIKEGRGRPFLLADSEHVFIKTCIDENPSLTLAELSELMLKKKKISVGSSVLSRTLKKLNLNYKKLSLQSIEKDSEEVKKKEPRICQR